MFLEKHLAIIKNNLYIKLILFFSVIVAFSLIFTGWFISARVSSMLIEKESAYSSQIIRRMENYISSKEKSFKQIFFNIYYSNRNMFNSLMEYLNSDDSGDFVLRRTVEDYLSLIHSSDADLLDVIIYKNLDNSVFSSIKSPRMVSYTYDFSVQPWFRKIKSSGNSLTIIPTYKPDYILTNNSNVITFAANIFDITSSVALDDLGTLMLNFNVTNFRNAFEPNEILKGYVLVLTKDGKVVYNSDGEFIGEELPYFDQLMTSDSSFKLDREYVFTINKDTSQSFIIASIIPKNEITKEVTSIQRMIMILIVSIIAFAILLTMIWTRKLANRIKRITSSMKKVESGIFDDLIDIHGNDEIDHIANNFNKMCVRLQSHINEIYISKINQNTAEMKAFQAQINPHFLYNTLESIRMKAVINEDTDVADMIYMLSVFFRWSIKTTKTIIPVSEEVSHVKYYLDLQKLRLGSRLDYSIDIPEEVLNCEIIKFTLQPLVENSIQHGIEQLMDGGKIRITSKKTADRIDFEIADNGPGIEKRLLEEINQKMHAESSLDDESVGLRSVNDRIRLMYGPEFGVDIRDLNGWTSVIVRIPAREM